MVINQPIQEASETRLQQNLINIDKDSYTRYNIQQPEASMNKI